MDKTNEEIVDKYHTTEEEFTVENAKELGAFEDDALTHEKEVEKDE